MKFKIRPEINEPKYYLHLIVISSIVLGILQLWKGGNMFNILNILVGAGLIGLSDIIAHTLLRLN